MPSKLGVPIKTAVSATILQEALNGTIIIRPLHLGSSYSGKVDKQSAQFFGVTINDQQAQAGIVVRVTSASQSKFKLLYFEHEATGGYGLALQEDSEKTGKVTSAGMYFLHFQVYRMDSAMKALEMAKDPDNAFFKRLEGLQPCEVSQLNAGTHIFAVYGDNFFKPAAYTIEAVCIESSEDERSFENTTQRLKETEAQILTKRDELRQFEADYKKALARYNEVVTKLTEEKQVVDKLVKERENVQSSFTSMQTVISSNGVSADGSGSSKRNEYEKRAEGKVVENGNVDGKKKRNWFSINPSRSDKKR